MARIEERELAALDLENGDVGGRALIERARSVRRIAFAGFTVVRSMTCSKVMPMLRNFDMTLFRCARGSMMEFLWRSVEIVSGRNLV